jgi:hypothetical protein
MQASIIAILLHLFSISISGAVFGWPFLNIFGKQYFPKLDLLKTRGVISVIQAFDWSWSRNHRDSEIILLSIVNFSFSLEAGKGRVHDARHRFSEDLTAAREPFLCLRHSGEGCLIICEILVGSSRNEFNVEEHQYLDSLQNALRGATTKSS